MKSFRSEQPPFPTISSSLADTGRAGGNSLSLSVPNGASVRRTYPNNLLIHRHTGRCCTFGHIDESHLHRGHKAAGGGGHYSIVVVSPKFENLNVMERIRLVHKALDHEMTGTPKLIHALQVKTFDNTQWSEKS